MKKFTATIVSAFILLLTLGNVAYALGPLIEGVMISNNFGQFRMSVSTPAEGKGLVHQLNPDEWIRFRVKVVHEDSVQLGFVSDGFAPTAEPIQLCTEEGCEALPIELGSEHLDWNDGSRVTYYLEAKSCVLCSWVPFEAQAL